MAILMNPQFNCFYNHDGQPHYVAYRLTKGNYVYWKNVPANDFQAIHSNDNWQVATLFNHESAKAWFNRQVKLMCQIAIMQ